jgi:hypothetical protein
MLAMMGPLAKYEYRQSASTMLGCTVVVLLLLAVGGVLAIHTNTDPGVDLAPGADCFEFLALAVSAPALASVLAQFLPPNPTGAALLRVAPVTDVVWGLAKLTAAVITCLTSVLAALVLIPAYRSLDGGLGDSLRFSELFPPTDLPVRGRVAFALYPSALIAFTTFMIFARNLSPLFGRRWRPEVLVVSVLAATAVVIRFLKWSDGGTERTRVLALVLAAGLVGLVFLARWFTIRCRPTGAEALALLAVWLLPTVLGFALATYLLPWQFIREHSLEFGTVFLIPLPVVLAVPWAVSRARAARYV